MFYSTCLFMLFIVKNNSCNEFFGDNFIIRNLPKREVLPLAQINNPYDTNRRRQFNRNSKAELSYRRSKDIRADEEFELEEASKTKEEDKDNSNKQRRWLTIDTVEGIGIGL